MISNVLNKVSINIHLFDVVLSFAVSSTYLHIYIASALHVKHPCFLQVTIRCFRNVDPICWSI